MTSSGVSTPRRTPSTIASARRGTRVVKGCARRPDRRARRARTPPRPCASRGAAGSVRPTGGSTSGRTDARTRGELGRDANPPSERNVLVGEVGAARTRCRRRLASARNTSASNWLAFGRDARRSSARTMSSRDHRAVRRAARARPRPRAPRGRGRRPRGHAAVRRAGGVAAQRLALAHRARPSRRPAIRVASSVATVAGPQTPSVVEAGVALELPERGLGLGPEDAVLAAGVEAEPVEPALQLGDVVAAQHRPAQVEQPVAEREAALDERAPRLRSADAVDAQAARCLERRAPRSRSRRRSHRRPRSRTRPRPDALLEVADRVAAIAGPQRGRSDVTRPDRLSR